MRLFKFAVDFIFPPTCLACKEECSSRYLCLDCWTLCELPDPVTRCRHCFEELDERGNLCAQCRKSQLLLPVRASVFDSESPARHLSLDLTSAMAGFALFQWIQLDWPMPTAIIPMPDKNSIEIGMAFAHLLNVPFIRALQKDYSYKEERLEEDEILLLFNVLNGVENLQKGALALSAAFPKRIYLLSLYL